MWLGWRGYWVGETLFFACNVYLAGLLLYPLLMGMKEVDVDKSGAGVEALKRWREENPDGVAARNPYERWRDNNTRKSAIHAFCWQCMGGSEKEANGARVSVRECPSGPESVNPCPLHAWRPYT